jgi:catabolite regulation protein CreA
VHCGFFAPVSLVLDSINLQKVTDMKCYIPRFLTICWQMNLERTVKDLSIFCVQKMLIH